MNAIVPIAADSPFPVQNLPWGVFRRPGFEQPRVGIAVGDWALDLAVLGNYQALPTQHLPPNFFAHQTSLHDFMAAGPAAWAETRDAIARLVTGQLATLRDNVTLRELALVPRASITMELPVRIANYTDFYSSREHATHVGAMMRGPDNALHPNWLHLPVGYHGRASSVVVSGTAIRRPWGQVKLDSEAGPRFSPSRRLDFELELGCLIGVGNPLGVPIGVDRAHEHIFGFVLVNDWSARDHQKWEYQPLGPFLSKNFCTSISPWVVPLAALTPFRVEGPMQDPPPLPYLQSRGAWNFDIQLEVHLRTQLYPQPQRIAHGNARTLYWNICQQIAHHTVGGCNLQTGDLLASGTISGEEAGTQGCMLELTRGGSAPLTLAMGESRSFLEDGDEITLTGWCQGAGYRIGFGDVVGTIVASQAWNT
jgi:fumarylacetoacetase